MSMLDAKPFVEDGKTAVHGLRRAFADVLASLGADASEPQEISRRFGLDKTLAWRIARVIREDDAWEAVQHIPRRPSVRLFITAMAKHGASADLVDSVWQALDQFERFVEVHSGDRETLEAMVSAAAKRSAGKRLEMFRKTGFQSNSALWGVQAKSQISIHIMMPQRDNDEMLSMATMCGLVDFRRLRPSVPWTVASLSQWDEPGVPDSLQRVVAIDPAVRTGEPPLVRRFCSDMLPTIRAVEERRDLVRFMLDEAPVGNTGAATVVMGWAFTTPVSKYQAHPGEMGEHGVMMCTPVESVVHDLFIHRSLKFAFNPTAHVYSQLPGGPTYPGSGRLAGLLPVPGEVVDLGAGPPDTTTPEVPRYREMFDFAVTQMGHTMNDFQGYRFRIRYAPIPALAVLRHALLPK